MYGFCKSYITARNFSILKGTYGSLLNPPFTPFRIEDAQYATPSPLITALCYAKKWAF
jgi:hypothetical protein